VTVALVFALTLRLKNSLPTALLAAGLVLGAGVLMTQSVVVEEYALAVMFFTLGLYGLYTERPLLMGLGLGLAGAVHIVAVALAGLVLLLTPWPWRTRLKAGLVTLAPLSLYALVPVMAATSRLPWLLADYSLPAINDWLGSSGSIGSLSVYDAPERVLQVGAILLASFGLALVPLVRSWREYKVLAVLMVFLVWLHFTDLDFTTWTFLSYAVPCAGIALALALRKVEFKPVLLSCAALIVVNTFALNPNVVNAQQPLGDQLTADTLALPDNALVLTSQGGFYTLGLFHLIAEGKPLELVFVTEAPQAYDDYNYQAWLRWENGRGFAGRTSVELVDQALKRGKSVYRVRTYLPELDRERYICAPCNDTYIQVVAVREAANG
jgi:hypothetical protein